MTSQGVQAPGPRFHRAAAALIGGCAAYQLALGAYFAVFRPALLPEDFRFLGTTAERLVNLPRLERWLDLVFVVLGGQMAALGVLLSVFAVHLWRGRILAGYELVLLGIAGVFSVAVMSAVNFALASNFRWVLVLPVLTWLIGVALAIVGSGPASTKAGARPHAR